MIIIILVTCGDSPWSQHERSTCEDCGRDLETNRDYGKAWCNGQCTWIPKNETCILERKKLSSLMIKSRFFNLF